MSFSLIFRIQGFLLVFIAASMAFPAAIALSVHEAALQGFCYAIACTAGTGLTLIILCPATRKQISHREGFMIVSLGWILAAVFGSLPFLFEKSLTGFTDAYFETVSGFTTTGATVFNDVESLPRSILFWRSMIQWLGGMGIILFSIAILPLLNIGGMQLYKAEVPGPVVEKIKPRIAETARTLWKVYVLLSLVEVVLLKGAGMSMFDAVCHTFTTMATGGFSTRNRSIEAFQNPLIDIIIIFFMVAAGMNFTLIYQLFRGKIRGLWNDKEFVLYLAILAGATLLMAGVLHGQQDESFLASLRHAAFQAASIMTTTGYSTANFDLWPAFAQYVLLLLMFIGGCAGSTGGGIKCVRILLLAKRCYRELFHMVHPHAVISVKISGKFISEDIIKGVTGFFIFYIFFFISGSLAMTFLGLDFYTAVASVATTLGNVGPGFASVGPYGNYAAIPVLGKWILICMMLLGRLEIFTLLILFIPEFWKK